MSNKKRFGTAPVFFLAISTILGAILFLRFGYAVGTIVFRGDHLKHVGDEIFRGYDDLGNILFVNSQGQKDIE